jgi:hypothetical protein
MYFLYKNEYLNEFFKPIEITIRGLKQKGEKQRR